MSSDSNETEERVVAEWTVHVIRQDPRKLATFLGLLLLANGILFLFLRWMYTSYPYLAILGNLILIGSVSDYLFPVRFRLTEEGANYRNLLVRKHISWADVRNCYVSDYGVKLSPLDKQSRLDAFRGFVLIFSNNRKEIVEHVERLAVNRT